MSDVIAVRDLRVLTRIGWRDEERAQPREVRIDLELHTDTRRAGAGDDLADTVDYHAVVVDVADFVRGSETRLLEALAEKIAHRCLAHDGVEAVSVEVAKPHPPIEEDLEHVAVRIHRP